MALIFMDGFDLYHARADWVGSDISTPNTTIESEWAPATGRDGSGKSISATGTSGTQLITMPAAAARGTTLFISFSFYPRNDGVPDDVTLLGLRCNTTGAANLLSVGITGNNDLYLTPHSGAVTYATVPLMGRVWNFVELQVTLGTNGTTGSFELRINGITAASASGIDTFLDTASELSIIRWTADRMGYEIDDLVIFTNAGAAPNTWLGDATIRTLLPTADGAVVDWTANTGTDWQAVDDPTSPDDDTTYIASSTVSQKSRFAMADLPNAIATIHGVQLRYDAKKTNVGARTMRGYIRSSATEGNGTTIGLATTYAWQRGGFFATDPNGGIAWTKAAVDAMEVGVEVVS